MTNAAGFAMPAVCDAGERGGDSMALLDGAVVGDVANARLAMRSVTPRSHPVGGGVGASP